MDLLHSWGVELAVHLQSRYRRHQDAFGLASGLADLHTAFYCWFPVWFHLHRRTALTLVWVAVLADWINLLLKWVLFGERPYWWVHETRFYGAAPPPRLQQFPITCETGPGSPSGHAMGAAAVWYVMVTAVLSIATERRCPPLLYRLLQTGLWALMASALLLVCMSRVYVAAHFPHQVVAGVLSGAVVAELVSRLTWIYSASMPRYLLTTFCLTSVALGFYVLLLLLGVDLLWTLEKAERWCAEPGWVRLDSTPFASLLRNMGSLLGLGLGLHSPLCTRRESESAGAASRLGCVVLSLLLLQLLDGWTFSSRDHVTFYLLSFLKSALALLVPTALVPAALRRAIRGEREKKRS